MMDNELDAPLMANAFLQATVDGTLSDIDEDSAYAMASAASADPGVIQGMTGKTDAPPGFSDYMFDRMMSDWFDSVFSKRRADDELRAMETREAAHRTYVNSVYRHSGLPPEEIGRAEFDAENGDSSPMLALYEKFYLG